MWTEEFCVERILEYVYNNASNSFTSKSKKNPVFGVMSHSLWSSSETLCWVNRGRCSDLSCTLQLWSPPALWCSCCQSTFNCLFSKTIGIKYSVGTRQGNNTPAVLFWGHVRCCGTWTEDVHLCNVLWIGFVMPVGHGKQKHQLSVFCFWCCYGTTSRNINLSCLKEGQHKISDLY